MNLPKIQEIVLPKKVKELINSLQKDDLEIYLVGGFVRDLILGVKSYDLDFVIVNKSAPELCKEISSKFECNFFLLDKKTETTRLVLKDEDCKAYSFDFTSVLKPNLEEDFKRRDFTINSLAINLKQEGKIIDRFNGLQDLKEKKVKVIQFKNFLDDPLRFLRAFRFACVVGGEIDSETLTFIKNNCQNDPLKNISSERISVELWKIFDSDNSFKYVKQLSDIGLLEKIFPEMTPMRKVTPNIFHHLWLYDHSIELVKTFEENFFKIPEWAKEELKKSIGLALSPTKYAVSKLACLFHDIAKPNTWEIKNVNGKEKHTFYGHDKIGANILEKIGERLKFSNAIIESMSKLVRYHLRPFQLSQNNEPITEKALYRFFRELNEDTPLLLMLALADHHATLGPEVTKENLLNGEKLILSLFDEYKKFQDKQYEKKKKPKLLDGIEVMELTGLKPSPELGKIVKELDELIAVGEIKTKEEAVAWVKRSTS